jgi:hypothetical protein
VSEVNDGGPAFPIPIAGCSDGGVYNTLEQSAGRLGGISMRDYFAAKAMQALITKSHGEDTTGGSKGVPLVAKYAYDYADEMLKARES